MSIDLLLEDPKVIKRIDQAETEEEFYSILSSYGLNNAEIVEFIERIKNVPEELTEDDLEDVVGGAPLVQKYLMKWAYRFKHKKWFVKATYDDTYIYVTNRFGEVKITEKYIHGVGSD